MKIVFLADALDVQYAGIYAYCKNLLQQMNQLQSLHEIFVIRASTQKDFPNLIEVNIPIRQNVPLHQRIRQLTSIPKYLNQLKPDVVVETAHFGPFRLHPNIKRVTFIHDLSPVLFPAWHPTFSVWAHQLFIQSIMQNAHLILTNSHFTKSEIERVYPTLKIPLKTARKIPKTTPIKVTPLASTLAFNQLPDDSILKKHQLTTPYFLYVGTIEPRKNINFLLQAYTAFRKKYPTQKILLVLAGKWGWKQTQLAAAIKNSMYVNDIKLTGFVSEGEKKALYQSAVAFIYPSLYEGFGLPLLEAMENACPVICSNASALPEVGGTAALYFQPTHIKTLVQHLHYTATHPHYKTKNQQKLMEQAKQFSWQKTARQTLAFIEAI